MSYQLIFEYCDCFVRRFFCQVGQAQPSTQRGERNVGELAAARQCRTLPFHDYQWLHLARSDRELTEATQRGEDDCCARCRR